MRRLAVPVRHFRNAAVTVRQNWQAAGPVRRMSVAAAATVGDQDLKSVNTERTADITTIRDKKEQISCIVSSLYFTYILQDNLGTGSSDVRNKVFVQ